MKEDTTPIDPTWMEKTGGFAKDMTLRDHYAGKAMQSFIAEVFSGNLADHGYDSVAQHAHRMADAMLKAREMK
jgi:hypothetical protein